MRDRKIIPDLGSFAVDYAVLATLRLRHTQPSSPMVPTPNSMSVLGSGTGEAADKIMGAAKVREGSKINGQAGCLHHKNSTPTAPLRSPCYVIGPPEVRKKDFAVLLVVGLARTRFSCILSGHDNVSFGFGGVRCQNGCQSFQP